MKALLAVFLLVGLTLSGAPVDAKTVAGNAVPVLKPATQEGAHEAVAYYAKGVIKPAFAVKRRAKGTCLRYLPTARRTIAAQGNAACASKLRAMKVMAMCHWLNGEDAPAEALVRELATARCEDGADGRGPLPPRRRDGLPPKPAGGTFGGAAGPRGNAGDGRRQGRREGAVAPPVRMSTIP